MLSVLFATRNGAKHLTAVLSSYRALRPPHGGWQLIVIDNGSSDESLRIVERFSDFLPLRILSEPTPGKNAALNLGLGHLCGDLAVFTDDDVFPHPDWLIRLRAAADEQPGYTVFGGRILPRWETPPPAWLLNAIPRGPAFALTDPSLVAGPTDAHNVFGPNMAVRASVFAAGARFSVAIGPRGTNYPMGSETEFVRRLLRAGHLAWHVADATVEHLVRSGQMKPDWVLERARRFGRGQYRMAAAAQPSPPVLWWGIPRYLYRHWLQGALRAALSACHTDRKRLLRARWELNCTHGAMIEARLIHCGRAPATTTRR